MCQEELFNTCVCLKSDDHKTWKINDLIDKTSTVTKLNNQMVGMFKEFVKNVLSEFKGN